MPVTNIKSQCTQLGNRGVQDVATRLRRARATWFAGAKGAPSAEIYGKQFGSSAARAAASGSIAASVSAARRGGDTGPITQEDVALVLFGDTTQSDSLVVPQAASVQETQVVVVRKPQSPRPRRLRSLPKVD